MEVEVEHNGLVYLVVGELRVEYTDAPEEKPIPYCEIKEVSVYKNGELKPFCTQKQLGTVPSEVAEAADDEAVRLYEEQ